MNVARRDGMGTVMLEAAVTIGEHQIIIFKQLAVERVELQPGGLVASQT